MSLVFHHSEWRQAVRKYRQAMVHRGGGVGCRVERSAGIDQLPGLLLTVDLRHATAFAFQETSLAFKILDLDSFMKITSWHDHGNVSWAKFRKKTNSALDIVRTSTCRHAVCAPTRLAQSHSTSSFLIPPIAMHFIRRSHSTGYSVRRIWRSL